MSGVPSSGPYGFTPAGPMPEANDPPKNDCCQYGEFTDWLSVRTTMCGGSRVIEWPPCGIDPPRLSPNAIVRMGSFTLAIGYRRVEVVLSPSTSVRLLPR